MSELFETVGRAARGAVAAVRSTAAAGAAAVALMIAPAALVAVAPTPAHAQESRVTSIEITGAQRIEAETIRSYLEITEGDVVTAAAINDALRRLFATGLFQDVRITPRASGVLEVAVVENPIINQISFEGNGALEDDVLQAQIRSRSRASFTRARAEADAQAILDLYRAAGRFSATVEPVIIQRDGNRVDLVFEISEGDAVGVSAINFVGNTEYSDRRLRGVVQTSESAWWRVLATSDNYDPDRLEFDRELLRRFYFSRGYADFEVLSAVAELSPERDGFFITFTVSEGERYDVGEVQLVSDVEGVDAEFFADLVETDSGDTYNSELVELTIRRIQERAGEEGVNFIGVRPEARKRRDEDGQPIIDITYRIIDAPRVYVERIEIVGNSRTLDRVIRREFEFAEGDAFNAYRLQHSRQSIRALGFFSRVDVDTVRGSSDDRVVVRTTVEEQSTGELSFGVGYSTSDSVGGQISITERNFLGRGQFVRFSVSATASRQFFDFRFTEPYFLGRNLRAGFDIFHIERDNQDASSFDTRQTGFRPRIGFPIDENSRIDFSYLIEQEDIRGVPVEASPLVQEDEGDRLLSAIGYDYEFDFRNNPNEPTRGFILRFGQDFAGVGGDAFHVRTEGSIKGYTSFFREEVVASIEFAGGALFGFGGSDDIQIGDRFFLGGDSFRGFENSGVGPRDTNSFGIDTNGDGVPDGRATADDALGGNYYAVVRSDISFPIGLPEEYGVYGGLFADVGTLWGLDDNTYRTFNTSLSGASRLYEVDDGLEIRASAGASLFWTSPFGPLRFNFAYPIVSEDEDETEVFRFTAGTRF